MKMGIIAAGLGERLVKGGITTPKPLVPIAGQPLISRIIHAAARLQATSVACIVNAESPAVAGYLRSSDWPVPLELTVKTTPSSMESLFCLAPLLSNEPFFLFTVDVVFGPKTLDAFFQKAPTLEGAKGALALTDHVDDEKPLWASIDADGRIVALGDEAKGSRYITAGFYYFTPDIFDLMETARQRKLTALRQFLGLLLTGGYPLYGLPVPKTLDVDYPEDIAKAEAYLREIDPT